MATEIAFFLLAAASATTSNEFERALRQSELQLTLPATIYTIIIAAIFAGLGIGLGILGGSLGAAIKRSPAVT